MDTQLSLIYLDLERFDLDETDLTWIDHPEGWRKQHEIWKHGNSMVSKPAASQQDLQSGIIQLQRSVELRDKLLDRLYSFDQIPGKPGSKYTTMADLEIIRPTLKTRLRELRNKLSHEDDHADINRQDCDELVDTAWYYLKATDHLAQQCVTDVRWHQITEKRHYYVHCEFFRPDWQIRIEGKVSSDHLSRSHKTNYLSISVKPHDFKEDDSGLRFYGDAVGPIDTLYKLVKIFFAESALR